MTLNLKEKIPQEKTYLFLLLLLWIISETAARFPDLVEKYYSNGIYLLYARWMRTLFGWMPFSFGDAVYIILVVTGIFWMVKNIKNLFLKPRWFIGQVLRTLAVAYGIFLFSWGLNYHRLPLYKSLDLQTQYTDNDLQKTLNLLIETTNDLHQKLAPSDSAMVDYGWNADQIFRASAKAYENLATDFPALRLAPQSLKKSLYSTPLTYMGFSGYFNPVTHEGQVDGIMPVNKFYLTSLHEQAHQLGYAAEEEANFIGWLAAVKHPDEVFNYYGYVFVLRYALNEWYLRQPEKYQAYLQKVKPGILAYYKESADFWKQYENPFEPVFKSTFNTYLKANKQSKGIESYNYVVGLLIGYLKKEGTL